MTYRPAPARILSMSADLSNSYLQQLAALDAQIAALDAHPTLLPAAHHKMRSRLVGQRARIEAAFEADKRKFGEIIAEAR